MPHRQPPPTSCSTIVTVIVIAVVAVGFLGLLYYKGMIGNRANARTIKAQYHVISPGVGRDNLQPDTVNELKTLHACPVCGTR